MNKYQERNYMEKNWNYNDLSDSEKAKYDKKYDAFHKVAFERSEDEDKWRKGKISADEYMQRDDKNKKKQELILKGKIDIDKKVYTKAEKASYKRGIRKGYAKMAKKAGKYKSNKK